MEKSARLYINRMISETRNEGSDDIAAKFLRSFGKSPEEYARRAAYYGYTVTAASYLNLSNLPIHEKAKILANAYYGEATSEKDLAYSCRNDALKAIHRREAARSMKLSRQLTRAAKGL